jgi:uncharacterized protein YbjT (DUF2867 family)
MTSPPSRTVVVAGGTGLVGKAALQLLAGRPELRTIALVRRTGAGLPPPIEERLFDYEQPSSYDALGGDIPCDVLLCCLGTTRRKAGSDEAFRRVDRDYPLRLLERLRGLPHRPVFGLVSSVGADNPRGLYLTTKAEVERAIQASGLPYAIVRPSLLVGEREESRPAERLGIALGVPIFRALQAVIGSATLDRYAPIEGQQVAAALLRAALGPAPASVLEGSALRG